MGGTCGNFYNTNKDCTDLDARLLNIGTGNISRLTASSEDAKNYQIVELFKEARIEEANNQLILKNTSTTIWNYKDVLATVNLDKPELILSD